MDDWFNKDEGALLLALERAELNQMLCKHFGDFLLQLGGPCNDLYTHASPIRNRVVVGDKAGTVHNIPYVVADFSELPLRPGSVDVIVCMHVLETVDNPKALLAQLYQALSENGQLIVIGFNPVSLWGLAKWRHKKKDFPWNGKFYRMTKVMALLSELGYSITRNKKVCFRPPMTNKSVWNNLLFLEPLGQLLFSWFGGVYFISATKQVEAMTPVPATNWRPVTT